MKFYFPTTSLNFDNIVSSQQISPAGTYRSGTLQWNNFERLDWQDRNSIILFSRIPIWVINDPDRDNYPMVIEIDKSFKGRAYDLKGFGKALVLVEPVKFSALEFEQGRVRILFRNEDEMERVVAKASSCVAECKIIAHLMKNLPNAISVIPADAKRIKLDDAVGALGNIIEESYDREMPEPQKDGIREERERGAQLGYHVGRYVRSFLSGCFSDAFRDPLSYEDWKKKTIPAPFLAVLEKILSRGACPWNPNRAYIAQFCCDMWKDCFENKKIDRNKLEGTPIHKSMRAIYMHWGRACAYSIPDEENPYVQAIAAFLECGEHSGKYPRFVMNPQIKKPEYLLALYGALVGYTFFSRSLLENRTYIPRPTPPTENPEHTICGHGNDREASNGKCLMSRPPMHPAKGDGSATAESTAPVQGEFDLGYDNPSV